MENNLRYSVRSREIVDLVNAMKRDQLTISPFFQRNLVWRDTHRREFIETIIKGFPFPQIFLARGPINLEEMTAVQCVVDGQQRLNAIRDFVSDRLEVQGKLFSHLSVKAKEDFLKYEVAVIDFDLETTDERLKEIFHRLNRTYYSLSLIERIASEYSSSDFLLVARVLCGDFTSKPPSDDFGDEAEDQLSLSGLGGGYFSQDPGIGDDFKEWMSVNQNNALAKIIRDGSVFSSHEFSRKVPLMFVLNLMCTVLYGYFDRNSMVRNSLDKFAENFRQRDQIFLAINNAAKFIEKMRLPKKCIWWNKANFFSLVSELSRMPSLEALDETQVKSRLLNFEKHIPAEYARAAREAVGRKPEREMRSAYVARLVRGDDCINEATEAQTSTTT
ncbi:MAG: DUF262 domain-containing protein [Roseomonas sp.]|nr:DUF262 domain-containing protein [Roseomonas sp.]MCA3326563.1 DUF262 domain-containing protein [Roseomonas sp.]MCA3331189.1 DUF262 domain-containing protein [Roseomonas sp.]MCA3334813.1 DUF262 domain-containing protein [Roseomonas sp.]MCA3345307.1 DUF262 domain-containing protein [Roseomonas sp.]